MLFPGLLRIKIMILILGNFLFRRVISFDLIKWQRLKAIKSFLLQNRAIAGVCLTFKQRYQRERFD